MKLRARIEQLELLAPAHRRRKPVPTVSLTAFVRGLLAGAFGPDDIDPMNPDQMNFLGEFHAYLVLLSPADQEWCEANPWGEEWLTRWERANLALTPAEFEALRALARPPAPASPASPAGTTDGTVNGGHAVASKGFTSHE
jgi:hypothetical protein